MNYKEKLGIPKQIRNLKHSCIIDPKSKPLGFLKMDIVQGEIFGNCIGAGADKIVYLSNEDPTKVLKIYIRAKFLNIPNMQKGINCYLKRNKLRFYIKETYKGYVLDETGIHYPVLEQEFVHDFVSPLAWNPYEVIEYFKQFNYLKHPHSSLDNLHLYNKYYKTMQIDDIRISNIIKKDDKYYLIDFSLLLNNILGDLGLGN